MVNRGLSRRRLLGAAAFGGAAGVAVTGAALPGRLAGRAEAAATLPADPYPSTVAHLIEAQTLVDYVRLADQTTNNVYKEAGDPTVMVWGTPGDPSSWIIRAQCNSFLTSILKRTYPGWATDAFFTQYFGQPTPRARDYQQVWATGQVPHFQSVTHVADLRPGDLIAVNYVTDTGSGTGHVVIVRRLKGVYTGNMTFAGETQYAVEIVDCTSDPHGVYGLNDYVAFPDTRMPAAGIEYDGGGYGHMMFYASDTTGAFSRYRWSVNTGSAATYTTDQRPITAVRLAP